jgi:hypothetical protein
MAGVICPPFLRFVSRASVELNHMEAGGYLSCLAQRVPHLLKRVFPHYYPIK